MKNLIILLIITIPLISFSQYTTKKKKAIKHFETARVYYDNFDELNTVNQLYAAIKIDTNFAEPYIFLASIYEQKKEFEKVIYFYTKAVKVQPSLSYKAFYYLGEAQLRLGKYQDAKNSFQSCIDFPEVSPRFEALSQVLIKKAEFGVEAVNNPVEFNPQNLGENVNTIYNDYWPSLTVDEDILTTTILLTRDKRFPVSHKNSQEDFYISLKKGNEWTKARNIGSPINTEGNEGSQAISPDGRYLFYSVCNRKEDFGSCDLYFTEKIGNNWDTPKNVGQPVSSNVWESNPTFSSDGKTLIFCADHRRGGYGKKDLFMSILQKDGTWTEPENLGEFINSGGNDIAPFIHPDGQTLYFSSDGHMGMGGMDLFVSRKNAEGIWQKPDNLGYPINTYKDEFGLIVNAHGNLAMYSSDRGENDRGQDIYSFDLPEPFQPNPVTYVKGKVFNAITKERLGADFQLIDLETSEVVVTSASNNETGEYIVCLPINKNYMFNCAKKGYLFFSENFSLKDIENADETFNLDIPLQPLQKGVRVVLNNIFFETDSYDLKPESQIELKKVTQFMISNMSIKVEIGGHTDNIGTKAHNQALSTNRAKAVYQYLITNGISTKRLSYRGYEFSSPIDTNENEKGRSRNRRTEFKIVEVE